MDRLGRGHMAYDTVAVDAVVAVVGLLTGSIHRPSENPPLLKADHCVFFPSSRVLLLFYGTNKPSEDLFLPDCSDRGAVTKREDCVDWTP